MNPVVNSLVRLLEIDSKPQRGVNSDEKFTFNKGSIRQKVEKLLDVNEDYASFRLAVNPDAIPPVQEFLPELSRKRKCDTNERYWLNGGTARHYQQLDQLLVEDKIPFASWPLVRKINIHSCNINQDTAFWPHIYLLRVCDESKFMDCLKSLHSDKVWERIVEREAPQNYTLPVLELWREKRVIPLSIDEKVFRIHGKTLKDIIDFFVQFENEYENTRVDYTDGNYY